MPTQFLHGIEVVNIDDGGRPIQTVSTSVIGIVGTAPDADPIAFPLNTPVLIAGSRSTAAKLDMTGNGLGTLPDAIDSILDQTGAVIVVVRVNKEMTDAATLGNVLGGVNPVSGQYNGMQAFVASMSMLGVSPKILIAPGFTQQRTTGGIISLTGVAGTGYTDGTYNLTVSGGTGGTGAAATATVLNGSVTARTITNSGSGYTVAPSFALPAGAGAGTGATFVATIGTAGNPVVANLIPIAEKLRAVIFADGPNTNDADAIAYAGDFGSKRVYLIDPNVLKQNATGIYNGYASAAAAGLQAKSDNDRGFWWSVSNQNINGIVGTSRAIDFAIGDASSRANLLNKSNVATIVNQNGYRLWGNRTLSSDAKWAYLCVVRTADIIADSIQASHLWAVDRGITKTYLQDVREDVRAFLRDLKTQGAILGGDCWIDPALNTADQIAQGNVTWDFDFTPTYPAEHLTFRMHLDNNYITSLF